MAAPKAKAAATAAAPKAKVKARKKEKKNVENAPQESIILNRENVQLIYLLLLIILDFQIFL